MRLVPALQCFYKNLLHWSRHRGLPETESETKVTCLSHVWHPDQPYANYRATYTTVTGLRPWPNTCSSPVPSVFLFLNLRWGWPWIHTRTHTHHICRRMSTCETAGHHRHVYSPAPFLAADGREHIRTDIHHTDIQTYIRVPARAAGT